MQMISFKRGAIRQLGNQQQNSESNQSQEENKSYFPKVTAQHKRRVIGRLMAKLVLTDTVTTKRKIKHLEHTIKELERTINCINLLIELAFYNSTIHDDNWRLNKTYDVIIQYLQSTGMAPTDAQEYTSKLIMIFTNRHKNYWIFNRKNYMFNKTALRYTEAIIKDHYENIEQLLTYKKNVNNELRTKYRESKALPREILIKNLTNLMPQLQRRFNQYTSNQLRNEDKTIYIKDTHPMQKVYTQTLESVCDHSDEILKYISIGELRDIIACSYNHDTEVSKFFSKRMNNTNGYKHSHTINHPNGNAPITVHTYNAMSMEYIFKPHSYLIQRAQNNTQKNSSQKIIIITIFPNTRHRDYQSPQNPQILEGGEKYIKLGGIQITLRHDRCSSEVTKIKLGVTCSKNSKQEKNNNLYKSTIMQDFIEKSYKDAKGQDRIKGYADYAGENLVVFMQKNHKNINRLMLYEIAEEIVQQMLTIVNKEESLYDVKLGNILILVNPKDGTYKITIIDRYNSNVVTYLPINIETTNASDMSPEEQKNCQILAIVFAIYILFNYDTTEAQKLDRTLYAHNILSIRKQKLQIKLSKEILNNIYKQEFGQEIIDAAQQKYGDKKIEDVLLMLQEKIKEYQNNYYKRRKKCK